MLNTREHKSSLHEENSNSCSITVCIGHLLVKCHFFKSCFHIFTIKKKKTLVFCLKCILLTRTLAYMR